MIQQTNVPVRKLHEGICGLLRYYEARCIIRSWNEHILEARRTGNADDYLIPHDVVNALADCSLYGGTFKELVDFLVQ